MDEQLQANGALSEHLDVFPAYVRPRSTFDKMLLEVAGCSMRLARDGRRAAMRTALDNRATWQQIRHWRRGTIAAPAWAVKILTDKLAARTAHQTQLTALGATHKPGRGQGWRRNT